MQLFQLSEATAARRRFYLHLVDATDGITPEVGEAGGQPQISTNGGGFGNTGATLTAIGNGGYYVELTAGELGTLGVVMVRYKSANTAEFQDVASVVAYDPYSATNLGLTDITTILADTNELQTDWADGGRLDLLLDAVKAVTDLLPDGGALSDLAIIEAVTSLLPDAGALNDLATIEAVTSLLPDAGALSDLALIKAVTDLLPDAGALSDLALIKAVTDLLPDAGALNDLALILTDTNAIKVSTDLLPSGVEKNVALPDFEFLMVNDTDHATPETGVAVTGTISQDGAAFGALTNAVVQHSNGIYVVDLTAAELNADIVTLRFSGANADDRFITIKTDT